MRLEVATGFSPIHWYFTQSGNFGEITLTLALPLSMTTVTSTDTITDCTLTVGSTWFRCIIDADVEVRLTLSWRVPASLHAVVSAPDQFLEELLHRGVAPPF
jgi:hypothetical protein